uniref:RNA-dependent RNA polymerase n=1 Tax=Sugar beet cyst nematode virus 2 TaxID=1958808 RepID=A0A2I4Q133_9VIRU|nr:RNA-dependent RNA polymerase [Sugar beet cyst nematode virus 2]
MQSEFEQCLQSIFKSSSESTYLNTRGKILITDASFNLGKINFIFDEETDDYFSFNVEVNENAFTDMSAGWTMQRNPKIVVEKAHLNSFIHDFTFMCLCDTASFDISVLDIFKRGYLNSDDDKTPDMCINLSSGFGPHDSQTKCVIEFTTSQSIHSSHLIDLLDKKYSKYDEILRSRSLKYDIPTRFCSMGVNRKQVIAPFNLPQNIADELVLRFHTAIRIYNYLVRIHGIDSTQFKISEHLSEKIDSALNLINSESVAKVKTRASLNHEKLTKAIQLMNEPNLEKLCFKDYTKAIVRTGREGFDNIDEADILMKIINFKRKHSLKTFSQRMKSVVNAPFFITQRTEFCDECIVPLVEDYSDPAAAFWRLAAMGRSIQSHSCKPHDIDNDRAYKFTRRRVEVSNLTDEIREYLAERGVQDAKRMRNEPNLAALKQSKKIPLSLGIDTSDVETFVNSPELMLYTPVLDETSDQEMLWELLQTAIDVHASTVPVNMIECSKMLMQTPMGQFTSFMSEWATELGISLRHFTGKDTFEIRKLPHFPVYIATKSKGLNKHAYISMLCLKESLIFPPLMSLFGHVIDAGNCYIIDFFSVDVSKLSNLIKSESFFLSQIIHWSAFYGIKPKPYGFDFTSEEFLPVIRMTHLMLLINWEDKATTEEVLTLSRYMVMELFKGHDTKRNPLKILDKLSRPYRSRLEVWAVNKLLTSMISPAPDLKVKLTENEDEEAFTWNNLKNPWTNDTILNPRQQIDLFYLGYAKNKEEKKWGNIDMAVAEKIVKAESDFDNARTKYLGEDSPDDPDDLRTHEYSLRWLMLSAKVIRSKISTMIDDDVSWEQKLEEEIKYSWSKLTFEHLGTFKASSQFSCQDKEVKRRVKVIEAILKSIQKPTYRPIEILHQCLNFLEESGCIDIDIFLKNQHGGLREISIMSLPARMVQVFLESIAKSCAKFVPEECIVNENSKRRIPKTHRLETAAEARKGNKIISYYSSNDATTWNQVCHPGKLGLFLCGIVPKLYHNFIMRVCNLWTVKHVRIPEGAFEIMTKHPGITFSEEKRAEIADAFCGRVQQRWLKPGSNHFTVESGFLQGILHYTSSLFHTGFLLARSMMFRSLCTQKGYNVIDHNLVSSDDSCRLVSLSHSSNKRHHAIGNLIIKADQLAISRLSKLVGIKTSDHKSTYLTTHMHEFNSEFNFGTSVHKPTIKWSLAALSIAEDETLIDRQETMYNQLADIVEGGATMLEAHSLQISQAFLHYRLMGLFSRDTFQDYFPHLNKFPDPSLGFFLLDSPSYVGLPGFAYNYWAVIQSNTKLSKKIKQSLSDGNISTTSRGHIVNNIIIRFGKGARLKRMRDVANKVVPDWESQINENPSILFRPSETTEEVLINLCAKLYTANASSDFGSGGIGKIIASCVYMIDHPCFLSADSWNVDETIVRFSLRELILKEVSNKIHLTREEMSYLFPLQNEYENLRALIVESSSKYTIMAPQLQKRTRDDNLNVFPRPLDVPYELKDICLWKWGIKTEIFGSDRFLEKCWKHCKKIFPWLHETLEGSFEGGKFSSYIQLRSFIERQMSKSRTMKLTAIPKVFRSVEHSTHLMLQYNYWPNTQLITHDPSMNLMSDFFENLNRDQQKLALMSRFPLSEDYFISQVKRILISNTDEWKCYSNYSKMDEGFFLMKYLALEHKGQEISQWSEIMETANFWHILKQSKRGTWGYTTELRKDRSFQWFGQVGTASLIITIKPIKGTGNFSLTDMIVDSRMSLMSNCQGIDKLLKQMKVTEVVPNVNMTSVETVGINFSGIRTIIKSNWDSECLLVKQIPNIHLEFRQDIKLRIKPMKWGFKIESSVDLHKIWTVYEYSHNIRSCRPYKESSTSPLDTWMCMQSLSPRQMNSLSKFYAVQSTTICSDKLEEFLFTCMLKSIRRLKPIPLILSSDTVNQHNLSVTSETDEKMYAALEIQNAEVYQMDWEDILGSDVEDYSDEGSATDVFPLREEDLEDFMTNDENPFLAYGKIFEMMDLQDFSDEPSSSRLDIIVNSHPLMDEIVTDYLFNLIGTVNWRTILHKGKINTFHMKQDLKDQITSWFPSYILEEEIQVPHVTSSHEDTSDWFKF